MIYYGPIGMGQTREQYTFATHPWSAVGVDGTEELCDGELVYIPTASSDGSTIVIGDNDGSAPDEFDNNGFDYLCNTSVNFMDPGPAYTQVDLTDPCVNPDGSDGTCGLNPVYGGPNDPEMAIQYCEETCDEMDMC